MSGSSERIVCSERCYFFSAAGFCLGLACPAGGFNIEMCLCALVDKPEEFPESSKPRRAAARRALFRDGTNLPSSTHMGGACRSRSRALSTRLSGSAQGEPVPKHQDADPVETREWVDAIDSAIANEGVDRARY